ncbi:hypothetical protein NA56DRAFT_745855 [Hyaloscypha hepaticicola]|uniref:Uncharacterized protein n=1 Tax=Hyaloscypha hepaticicola TaxID=2082293 RepID=A0A2J6QDV6_9HELO|nr:hypothetical protein NA56DRAFT_745855 [Hyaloscypha hepaticicola]
MALEPEPEPCFTRLQAQEVSRASSKSSASSTPRVSRASSILSASSTSSIASIEKVQFQILGQLYTIQSQDLSFLRKNDPLYGSPQNRQLRKSTAASPPKSATTYRQLLYPQNRQLRKSTAASLPKSAATYRQLPHPLNRRLRKSTAVSSPKLLVTQSITDTPSPVESNTLEALESTVNAFTAVITTAIPYTLVPLTTPLIAEYPENLSSFTQSIYKANSLYEIDGLHEINSFEHGYWEGMGIL